MGLVDYSDSESETEVQPKAPAKETKPSNSKPFQKFVDRSNPGKILVNLPTTSSAAESPAPSDEPPAKRARTTGGSRFSGFSSFLPPPKTTAKPASSSAQSSSSRGSGNAAPRPGVHLKTGAEPAFSREQPSTEEYGEDGSTAGAGGGGLKLPPPKNHNSGSASGPSIPADQIPAEDVKLVGKPLMFKPLSVSRKPAKKKTFKATDTTGTTTPKKTAEPPAAVPTQAQEQPKKKISLFSIGAETDSPAPAEATSTTGAYEPLFSSGEGAADAPAPTYDDNYSTPAYNHTTYSQPHPTTSQPESLSSIANDLHLSAQARRELFGRDGMPGDAARVVNFDMSREYEHNETIRQSGEAVTHNPVRSIRAGKHNLRQLVNAVQSNASALEESFAKGKGKRSEAGARYGWR